MAEILVVEDSPDQAALVAALLEGAGHKVRPVAGGEAALERIAESARIWSITDLVMPGMNGLELVGEVRKR